MKETKTPDSIESYFTDNEIDVLKLICKGLTHGEIANTLNMKIRKVREHEVILIEKTGSRNPVGLLFYAIKNGIVRI